MSTHNYTLKNSGFTAHEIKGMAEVHASEIKGGFLSSLGIEALLPLYQHATQSKFSIIVAAFAPAQSKPLGIIWGTTNCGALYREFMLRKSLSALRVYGPRLISWTRLRRAWETLLYPSRNASISLPTAEILNFAVVPESRGTGLSRDLFCALMVQLRFKGVSSVKIVTGQNQKRAHRFYEKMGAENVGSTRVHKEAESLIYLYQINESVTSGALRQQYRAKRKLQIG